jgi:hypothetical protein
MTETVIILSLRRTKNVLKRVESGNVSLSWITSQALVSWRAQLIFEMAGRGCARATWELKGAELRHVQGSSAIAF